MKKLKLILPAVITTLTMSFTSLAGEWKQDNVGWWYKNDDGSYTTNRWQWIDSNADGIAECYYFDANGYCLMNTTTPDNCSVNSDGAWIVDGIIQQQTVSAPANTESIQTEAPATPKSDIVWLSKTGDKYHADVTCGNMKAPVESTLEEAIAQGKTACSKCYQEYL